jgi:hypothetical protein
MPNVAFYFIEPSLGPIHLIHWFSRYSYRYFFRVTGAKAKKQKKRAGKMVINTKFTGAFNLKIRTFSADSFR